MTVQRRTVDLYDAWVAAVREAGRLRDEKAELAGDVIRLHPGNWCWEHKTGDPDTCPVMVRAKAALAFRDTEATP